MKWIILSGLLFLWGCSQADSANVAIGEFYASLVVSANSAHTLSCEATFRVGGATGSYIDLSSGDSVSCSDGTDTVTLTENSSIIGSISYEASSGLTYTAGGTYQITLVKDGISYTSEATLPTAMEITVPTANQTVTKGSILTTTWEEATSDGVEAKVSWESNGITGSTTQANESDDGTYDFPATATETKNASGSNLSGDVSANVTLTRHKDHSVHATFKGGTFTAKESNSVAIRLVD